MTARDNQLKTQALVLLETTYKVKISRAITKNLTLDQIQRIMAILAEGKKSNPSDTIREGDPRYNLVQDLLEGDPTRQDWAAESLKKMRLMNHSARVEFMTQNPPPNN